MRRFTIEPDNDDKFFKYDLTSQEAISYNTRKKKLIIFNKIKHSIFDYFFLFLIFNSKFPAKIPQEYIFDFFPLIFCIVLLLYFYSMNKWVMIS